MGSGGKAGFEGVLVIQSEVVGGGGGAAGGAGGLLPKFTR